VLERHRLTSDQARPAAVQRRRQTGQRTARENIADLVDTGTFVEYGPLTIAARRARNTLDELIAQSPADGLVMGLAQVNGGLFAPERARCAVMAYDYTVLAGTQGQQNHRKKDRLFEIAERRRLPVVLFAEGGGGRPARAGGGRASGGQGDGRGPADQSGAPQGLPAGFGKSGPGSLPAGLPDGLGGGEGAFRLPAGRGPGFTTPKPNLPPGLRGPLPNRRGRTGGKGR